MMLKLGGIVSANNAMQLHYFNHDRASAVCSL